MRARKVIDNYFDGTNDVSIIKFNLSIKVRRSISNNLVDFFNENLVINIKT